MAIFLMLPVVVLIQPIVVAFCVRGWVRTGNQWFVKMSVVSLFYALVGMMLTWEFQTRWLSNLIAAGIPG
jgi:hypothetical protein